MRRSYLYYPLVDGYIHNWLVAGPHTRPVVERERLSGADYKAQLAREFYQPEADIRGKPIEHGECEAGEFKGRWNYVRTRPDHRVDLSSLQPQLVYQRAWAYSEIDSSSDQRVTFVLSADGPAEVWLNGQSVHRQERFAAGRPVSAAFSAALKAGFNRLLVRFETVAERATPYTLALRLTDFAPAPETADKALRLPTGVPDPLRRMQLELFFEACHLRQDVYTRKEEIILHLPEGPAAGTHCVIRQQDPAGAIYAEAHRDPDRLALAQTSETPFQSMGFTYQSLQGRYRFVGMPQPVEYYEQNVRITRSFDYYAASTLFSTRPYGDYAARRREALVATTRRKDDLFAELVKMELGEWDKINPSVVTKAAQAVARRDDGAAQTACGLLSMLYRYADRPGFPAALRQPAEDSLLQFRYWADEPGQDSLNYQGEAERLLFHTAEILAGQRYAEAVFGNAGQPGRWHREKGEQLALEWLQARARRGFDEWDSNTGFAACVVALATLVSLAESRALVEMAAVVLDKLFFTLAVYSFQGVFGSTHGRSDSLALKTGYCEPTSGLSRLLWGAGLFNEDSPGLVALACSDYELPPLIAAIAHDALSELWSREQHGGQGCSQATYKTPDYLLCSAQDYRPGEAGSQEHIWQATLSPLATIFTSHPASAAQSPAHRPDNWCGNAVLPRVAQWKDALTAIYNFPADDWMGFTHAYFPVHALDEHILRDRWAFARVGDGYLALMAANGLTFETRGDNAYRELQSAGTPNVWLCQMGRAAQDGGFADFVARVLALPLKVNGDQVEWTTLRGDRLSFGWQGLLRVNDAPQALSGFKHYDNPYCVCDFDAPLMELRHGADALRLHLAEEEPAAR